MKTTMTQRYFAEFMGTFFFVLIGCGTAITAASLAGLGVALAFGLTLAAMHFMTAPISGGHLNPAVSFFFWLCKKMDVKDFLFYVVAQLLGATIAIGVLYFVLSGKTDFNNLYYTNGFGMGSPNGSGMLQSGIIEILLTAFFIALFVHLQDAKGTCVSSSLLLGLALTAAYFLATPFTNGSLNPARSFGPALFEGGYAMQQIWFFFLMPMLGSIIAMFVYKTLGKNK